MVPQSKDPCGLSVDSAPHNDTLRVALADSVDFAHAPAPANDSERLVFRQLFETLIRLDCRGEVRPGLASTWASDVRGNAWTFTLRPEAPFADNTPLTAARLVSSWQSRPGTLHALGIDSARALDDRRLRVWVRAVEDSQLAVFADAALSATPSDSFSRPTASMPLLVHRGDRASTVLEFLTTPGADLRDALDRGADLVVTRDLALVEYAAKRPDLAIFPLPWSRTYVLMQRTAAESLPLGDESVQQTMARDAVRADARPAAGPLWWDGQLDCNLDSPVATAASTAPRIVYLQGDEAARGLAERVVALGGSRSQLRTAGLGNVEFKASFSEGRERGYILALPSRTLDPCRESEVLRQGWRIHPLIDTRAFAIVRRGSPRLSVDWDGTVRLQQDLP